MEAEITLWIPAVEAKWFNSIGNESFFVAAVKKATTCPHIGQVLSGVTPETRQLCEREMKKVSGSVGLIEMHEPPGLKAASLIRFFLIGLQASQTPWVATLRHPYSNFLDTEALEYALGKAGQNKLTAMICGAFDAWQFVLLHRSLVPALENIVRRAEHLEGETLHNLFSTLDTEYSVLVGSYRKEVGRRLGHHFDFQTLKGVFETSSGGSISAYEKVTDTLGVSLSQLNIANLIHVMENSRLSEDHKPKSVWLEISAVNDAPPIYSSLNLLPTMPHQPPYMTLDIFSKVLSMAAAENVTLHLSGMGEPLQNPNIMQMLKIIQDGKAAGSPMPEVNLYTDARYLTGKMAEAILKSPIYSVMISLDAVDEIHYLKVRPGGNFQEVKHNVDSFLDLKRKKPRIQEDAVALPIVALTTTMISELEDHIDTFMTSYMTIHRYMSRFGKNPPDETKKTARRAYMKQGHGVEYLVIQGASTFAGQNPDRRLAIYTPLKRFPCRRLGKTIFVKTDGSVVACDRVLTPTEETRIGHVMHIHSLQDIWKRMESHRRAHREGRYADALPLCSTCEDWFIPVD